MTATVDTRKRSRDEDGCDFMPLSKRINNLHINNPDHTSDNNYTGQDHQQQFHHAQQPQQMGHLNPPLGHINFPAQQIHQSVQQQQQHQHQIHQQHQHHIAHHQHDINHLQQQQNGAAPTAQSHQHNNINNTNSHMQIYSPELNHNENPFYYNKNKLLYDLHAERMLRNH